MIHAKYLGQMLVCVGAQKIVAQSTENPDPGLQTSQYKVSPLGVRTCHGAVGSRKSMEIG